MQLYASPDSSDPAALQEDFEDPDFQNDGVARIIMIYAISTLGEEFSAGAWQNFRLANLAGRASVRGSGQGPHHYTLQRVLMARFGHGNER